MNSNFDIVIIGLSITSSWGNGHATTYRSLVRGLARRGHRVLFLERNLPWYAENRDSPCPEGAVTEIYETYDELVGKYEAAVRAAKLVIVGSFVREGTRIGEWVTSVAKGKTAFYDIDTPVTMAQLAEGGRDYITPALVRRYDLYLSFTGGPVLDTLENKYGARMARVFYCSVDSKTYRPLDNPLIWDLGYIGTYSPDRQAALDALLLEPARRVPEGRFAVVGPMYPDDIRWPSNVDLQIHLSPKEHAAFYGAQRFTLNVTREEMKKAGYSPSVRLFEAGACATPIITDYWNGLDTLFEIGKEILVSSGPEDTLRYLRDISEQQRKLIGFGARIRILTEHTPEHRALQLESYMREIDDNNLPHSPRPNGGSRKDDHRVAAGMAFDQPRDGSGEAIGESAGENSNQRNIYEPVGTRGRNRGADREASPAGATPSK